jgi:hypothetical protein
MSFAAAIELSNSNTAITNNGMPTNATTSNPVLDLFALIGSSRGKNITQEFDAAFQHDPVLTLKVLFWARDARGGAGERETFRILFNRLCELDLKMAIRLLTLVPIYGRWDDLLSITHPVVSAVVLGYYADELHKGDALASKWAPRQGPIANKLRKLLGLKTPKEYRQLVVNQCRTVEQSMCARQWHNIHYEHVPSLAGARYQKAFSKNDAARYNAWKETLKAGTGRVNSRALFPYDVLKSLRNGDTQVAQAQWDSLPNLLGSDNILPMVDTSGSMLSRVGADSKSSLTCADVALSLGLYVSDKQQGAFKDLILTFSGDSHLQRLEGNLSQKLTQLSQAHWGMNTSIERAFREILRVAVMGNVPNSEMPKIILVLSDLEFDSSSDANQMAWSMAQETFQRHGYTTPKIVWWNLNARAGNFPVRQHATGAALVSGFSPSILKSVLKCEEFSPLNVMMETLNNSRYESVGMAVSSTE